MHMADRVRAALSDDLRRAPWRESANPLAGHCYVASEALYHLEACERGFRPVFIRHEGQPHWFLRDRDGNILDLTASQFVTPVPYDEGTWKGFLTREPSKRARVVIERVLS